MLSMVLIIIFNLNLWIHNRCASNFRQVFSGFFSVLHVGFCLVKKTLPCIFSLVCSLCWRNNKCKKLSFLRSIFWRSFVEWETIENFCFTEHKSQVVWANTSTCIINMICNIIEIKLLGWCMWVKCSKPKVVVYCLKTGLKWCQSSLLQSPHFFS